MHFHVELYLENKDDWRNQVEEIMEPFAQDNCHCFDVETNPETENECHCETPRLFDWSQIGGRWSGAHAKSYNPRNDPRSWEDCDICGGPNGKHPGMRNESEPCRCARDFNITKQKGVTIKWPTSWADFEGDIIAVKDLPPGFECHTLIVNGEVYDSGHIKVAKELKECGITDGYLVTVDCHT